MSISQHPMAILEERRWHIAILGPAIISMPMGLLVSFYQNAFIATAGYAKGLLAHGAVTVGTAVGSGIFAAGGGMGGAALGMAIGGLARGANGAGYGAIFGTLIGGFIISPFGGTTGYQAARDFALHGTGPLKRAAIEMVNPKQLVMPRPPELAGYQIRFALKGARPA